MGRERSCVPGPFLLSDTVEIKITLPDGSERTVPKGTPALEVARGISERLAKKALAAKVNGKVVDLSRPLIADAAFEVILEGTPDGVEVQRHSTAHIMASAVQKLFPGTKVTIGPTVENGFY